MHANTLAKTAASIAFLTAAPVLTVLAAAGPAVAAPPAPVPHAEQVEIFGPFTQEATCAVNLMVAKGTYRIPQARQANRWHEGARFSTCHRVGHGRWVFTLTAPAPGEQRR